MNKRQQLIATLKLLPEAELEKALAFVDYLIAEMLHEAEQLPVIE